MKGKLFFILLIIVLLSTGCGDVSENQEEPTASAQSSVETDTSAAEQNEAVVPDNSPADDSGTAENETAEDQAAAPSLPGLSPVDIYLNLENEPYSFEFGNWSGENVQSKCGSRVDADTGAELTACIYSSNLSDVVWVEASVIGPDLSSASWYFPYMATVPYDGSEPEKAAQWVQETWQKVDKEGVSFTETFGDAVFEIYGNGKTSIFLEIKPVSGLDEWLFGLNSPEGGSQDELSEDEIREALKNLGLTDEEIDKQIEESKK